MGRSGVGHSTAGLNTVAITLAADLCTLNFLVTGEDGCSKSWSRALSLGANLTQQWLQRYGWEILPHPAHSPELAPSDFHLFGPLKRHLGSMAFETEDDLISELRNWFDNLDVDLFRVGIKSLLSR
ncbi:transposase [Plakobranchus ocellatus]|uniref:Transposase n=1 Tax=Plakobranchus ocellatus TaxID=259542 RepID=A0AAV3YDG2_9GAST|nr:transposase [Plakobranchus ocellatus]